MKKAFLKMSQNSQENTRARVSGLVFNMSNVLIEFITCRKDSGPKNSWVITANFLQFLIVKQFRNENIPPGNRT